MSALRIVVHVAVESFFESCHGRQLDALVSLTGAFERVLERHASGWSKPSADEAVLVSEPPWGARGSPMSWAEALRTDLTSELALPVSVGMAPSRFAARICSRLARPSGILLWMEGHQESLIGGLPLEELDELRGDQLGRLRARGVRTLDELARLGPDDARQLLGSEGEKIIGLVRGADGIVEPDVSPRAQHAIGLLARRLARRLNGASSRARGLELRLVYRDGVVRERYTLLPHATARVDALRMAAERLLALSPRRPDPLAGVAISATGLTGVGGQLDLFSGGRPRDIVVCLGRAAAVDLTAARTDGYSRSTFPGGRIDEENLDSVGSGAPSRDLRGSRIGGGRKLDGLHRR